jgi:hypothetical protein
LLKFKNMKQKLYFFFTTNQAKNKYLSVVKESVMYTINFSATCLYTETELEKIKFVLKKNNITFDVGLAKSKKCCPTDFVLNPFNQIAPIMKNKKNVYPSFLIMLFALLLTSCSKNDTPGKAVQIPCNVTASNMLQIGNANVSGQQFTITITNAKDVKQILCYIETSGNRSPISVPKVNSDTTYKLNFWAGIPTPCYHCPIHFEVIDNSNNSSVLPTQILSN